MRSATSLLSLVLLAACSSSDTDTETEDSGLGPQASITSPSDGASFQEEREFTLQGLITPGSDSLSQLTAAWTASGEELCPPSAPNDEGVTSCTASLAAGQFEIQLRATDSDGRTDTDRILVVVQQTGAPEVTILAPQSSDGPFYSDAPIAFLGRVIDDIDTHDLLSGSWASDLDGDLGDPQAPDEAGELGTEAHLSEGEHVVTLRGVNSAGRTGEAIVRLTVGGDNRPPTCAFLAPEDGGSGVEGSEVTFRALVQDEDIDDSQLMVVLESSIDGLLAELTPTDDGEVEFTTTGLSGGSHEITLTATDEIGASCTADLFWTVGNPPDLVVVSPTDGAVINEGESVDLIANVFDASYAPPELVVSWSTAELGELVELIPDGEGRTATVYEGLAPGSHELRARVTNPDGIFRVVRRDLLVNSLPTAPEIRIDPESPRTADALTALIDIPSEDPDGHSVEYRYAWSVDGELVEDGTEDRLSSSMTTKGELWSVAVYPSDGFGEGPAGTAAVEIGNTPPTVASVTLAPTEGPTPPDTTQDLRCTPGTLFDVDPGDAVTTLFSWSIDGEDAGVTTDVLPSSATSRGQEISCTVIPTDGEDEGAPVSSASLTIINSAPSIESVSILPSEPTASDTLTCSWSGFSDPDGDEDASTVEWLIDGAVVGTGTTLEGGFRRDDVVTCRVTPSDGTDDGTSVSAGVTIQNTLPTIDSVHIAPSSPDTTDSLTCTYEGYSDADADEDMSEFRWYVDSVLVGTSAVLSHTRTSRDDLVRCEVTPHDGTGAGTPVSAELTIGNAIPSVSTVTVVPTAPGVLDEVECIWSGFSDADLDEDLSRVQWFVDGEAADTSPILSAPFAKGQALSCQVTPYDGRDEGDPVLGETVANNTAPSIEAVRIIPEEPAMDDDLTCEWEGFFDPDEGDEDLSRVEWLVDDEVISTSATLDVEVDRARPVTCRVTPYDGEDFGEPRELAVMVGNRLPSIGSVFITPPDPITTDDLECAYTDFFDPDGDPDHSFIDWFVNGEHAAEGPSLPDSAIAKGDHVRCRVTPNDGIASAAPVSVSLTVRNAPPRVESASISPTEPRIADPLTCSWAGYFDPDGDPDASTVRWLRGSTVIGTGPTLDSGYRRDQDISCEVTAHDGESAGNTVTAVVRIRNTPPSITSVSISPTSPMASDTLTCSWAGFFDEDPGDTDLSVPEWYVNGSKISEGGTLAGAFSRDDTVECRVRPFDGTDHGTMLSSSVIVQPTPPTIESVSILPTAPSTSTDLVCSYSGFHNPDGLPDESRFDWTIDGSPTGVTTSTLPSSLTNRGDRVRCTVTPSSGGADGPSRSAEAAIGNAVPSVTGVSIIPVDPTVLTSSLTCDWTFIDDDDDEDRSEVLWLRGDDEVGTGEVYEGEWVKGDLMTCIVTPFDGIDTGDRQIATRVIGNVAPEITELSFDPDRPRTEDTVRVLVSFEDPDRDDHHTISYRWWVSGAEVDLPPDTDRLAGDHFSRDEEIDVEVVVDDGDDKSEPRRLSTVVENTPPSLTGVSISPLDPRVEDEVRCEGVGYFDPDEGDPMHIDYEWRLGSPSGEIIGEGAIISGLPDKGSRVFCLATPSDDRDAGASVSGGVEVRNTAPVMTSVDLTPTSPVTTDTLRVTGDHYDPDSGDVVTYRYDWRRNGVWLGLDRDSLSPDEFKRGDRIQARMRGHDGEELGPWRSSAEHTVGNSPPSISGVSVTPPTARFGETLTCSHSGYSDPDGDPDLSRYEWTIDGTPAGDSPAFRIETDLRDRRLACSVTAFDGTDTGNTLTAEVEVVNTPPVMTSVVITPPSPRTTHTLTSAVTASDPDPGDLEGLTYRYRWRQNGTLMGVTTANLPTSQTSKGNDYEVEASANDGFGWSAWRTSNSLRVLNTPPVADGVRITPDSPGVEDSLTCIVEGYFDADDDPDETVFSWYVDGVPAGSGPSFSYDFRGGESVMCRARVHDGEDAGPTLTASVTIDEPAGVSFVRFANFGVFESPDLELMDIWINRAPTEIGKLQFADTTDYIEVTAGGNEIAIVPHGADLKDALRVIDLDVREDTELTVYLTGAAMSDDTFAPAELLSFEEDHDSFATSEVALDLIHAASFVEYKGLQVVRVNEDCKEIELMEDSFSYGDRTGTFTEKSPFYIGFRADLSGPVDVCFYVPTTDFELGAMHHLYLTHDLKTELRLFAHLPKGDRIELDRVEIDDPDPEDKVAFRAVHVGVDLRVPNFPVDVFLDGSGVFGHLRSRRATGFATTSGGTAELAYSNADFGYLGAFYEVTAGLEPGWDYTFVSAGAVDRDTIDAGFAPFEVIPLASSTRDPRPGTIQLQIAQGAALVPFRRLGLVVSGGGCSGETLHTDESFRYGDGLTIEVDLYDWYGINLTEDDGTRTCYVLPAPDRDPIATVVLFNVGAEDRVPEAARVTAEGPIEPLLR